MRRTLPPIFLFLVGAIWLVAGLAFAGRFLVEVELYSHFQPPVMVVCAAAAIVGLVLRRWGVGFGSLLLTAALGWSTAPYLLPPPSVAADSGPRPIRILWSNLQNWSTSGEALDAVLHDAQADIVVLTELSARHVRAVERARARWPYQTRFPQGSAFDLLMLSRWQPRDLRIHQPFGDQFPIFDALICPGADLDGWAEACVAVVALHAVRPALPGGFVGVLPTRRDTMLAGATAAVRQRIAENHRVVLMGDFNTTPWSASFRRVLGDSGLLDSATEPAARPRWTRPTWFSRWPGLGLPIDHMLLSPTWRIHERRLGPFFGSDHRPVVIELSPIGRSG
jgi:endonuclease/exonuclease/phosphatase (EEP) superfamily protein YafD